MPKKTEIVRLAKINPNLSQEQIGQIVDCDQAYVCRVLKRYGVTQDKTDEFKQLRADVLTGVQSKIIESIADDDLSKVSLRDKVVSFGILYDKERLERGLSTQNVELAEIVQIVDKEIAKAGKE
jgi:hypothetical protein